MCWLGFYFVSVASFRLMTIFSLTVVKNEMGYLRHGPFFWTWNHTRTMLKSDSISRYSLQINHCVRSHYKHWRTNYTKETSQANMWENARTHHLQWYDILIYFLNGVKTEDQIWLKWVKQSELIYQYLNSIYLFVGGLVELSMPIQVTVYYSLFQCSGLLHVYSRWNSW